MSDKNETTNPSNHDNLNPAPKTSGLWIAVIMIGLIALIVIVDLLKSK